MTLITINIPQELRDKLKEEDNQSALISKLLMDYYQFNSINPTEAIKQIEEKKSILIQELDKQKDKLVEIEEKQLVEEINETETESKRKAKRNELISNCITNTRDIFGIDLTIAQAEELLDGDYATVAIYLDQKGLKPLEIEDAKQELH